MASLSPARAAAADVLSNVRRRSARARDLLRTSAPVARLTPADRALATRLVLGSVRASGTVDALLDAHLRRGHLEPRVRDALRISAFELLWLATPTPVALSQGVELVRRVSPRGAGLVPRATCLPGCLELSSSAGLATSGLVDAVDVMPADMAAQVVAWLASPAPSTRMLEVGQGRGTKSLLLESCAVRRGGLAHLSAVELEPFKVAVSRARMERAGLSGAVTCTAFDGCRLGEKGLPEELAGQFDSVFVDAPCSGSGTLRRHPEIAWSLEEPAVRVEGASLPALQLELLRAVSHRVGAGGTLAYATCPELREEDENVVAAFLASPEGTRFSLVAPCTTAAFASLPAEAQGLVVSMTGTDGMLRTSRADDASRPLDGHFLALLVREA